MLNVIAKPRARIEGHTVRAHQPGGSGASVPDSSAQVVKGRVVEGAVHALEPGGCGVDLGTVRGVDRGRVTFYLTVLDMHLRAAGGNTHAPGADVAVRDVDLAAVLGRHGIAVELEIAIVDMQQTRALADDRVVAPLDRRTCGRRLALRACSDSGCPRRCADGVARTGSQHPTAWHGRCLIALCRFRGRGLRWRSCRLTGLGDGISVSI